MRENLTKNARDPCFGTIHLQNFDANLVYGNVACQYFLLQISVSDTKTWRAVVRRKRVLL